MKISKKELKRKLELLEAQSIHRLTDAYTNIKECSTDKYMASGVTITIKNINKENSVICQEFMVSDGLSEETIEAIKKDIKRSYDLKMSFIKEI